jgi:FkbM family methyltransferase
VKNPIWSVKKRLNSLTHNSRICRYEGSLFLLDPKEGLDKKIMAGIPYERDQLKFASSIINQENIGRLVDVGANFGLYTVVLGRLNSVNSVDAFEPVGRTFNQLSGNVFLNRLDGKTTLHNSALGSRKSQETIHISPENSGLATFEFASTTVPLLFSGTQTVSVQRGDDLLKFRREKVFMKIDVEGFVSEVLRGLENFLSENNGFLQIEVNSNDKYIFELLNQFGWRCIRQMPSDAFFQK